MKRHVRRLALGLVVTVTLVAVPAVATLSFASIRALHASAAGTTTTFNPNLLLQGSNSAAEPSIRTDSRGTPFVIAPVGLGGGCLAFRVTHDGSASSFLGQPDHTAGGGDCDWAVGPKETSAAITPAATDDVLAYSSLSLANITTGKSDDGGATFGPPNVFSQQVGGDDRMWMAADPKLNSLGYADIFMTYHDVGGPLDIELGISVDGGFSYVQSGPIINNSDVPPGQWEGAVAGEAGAGNELGNIVAYRPSGGSLTLFSIFATPDSQADNLAQSQAGTTNFNRLYEAVGTVTDGPLPTIAWRNYEIYRGPVGARYNRIFPITAVDANGRVYAFWTDDNAIYTKSDATGTGWNPQTAAAAIPNPSGNNVALMPWAQAGKAGIADVVFYGANGGAGAQPNPQDDPNNNWYTYFAQTTDGGGTWTVTQASDHMIHHGPLCIDGLACDLSTPARDRTLLDFFQVSIDPTNGAADIAYADDHAAPGSAVLYFTRQCTGISATTGTALTNDCQAPPPPPPLPQGNTCPGPQVVDFSGDAPNSYPGGDGSNMANLDVVNAYFSTPDANNIAVTMTFTNLSAPPPPVNLVSAYWTVYWTYNGTTYYAQATSNSSADVAYSDGTYTTNFNAVNTSLSGTFVAGPNGTITIIVPRADVGNPANGATLTNPYSDTHGSFTVNGTGVFYTAAADRAPNAGYSASYGVGQTCSTQPPCHDNDGTGDLHGKHGGTATFKTDADACHDGDGDGDDKTNTAQFSDPGSHVSFISTQILSMQFNDATHTVTMLGKGTDNGVPVRFTIVEVNGGSLATDTYSIQLSDGYSLSGSLIEGSLSP
jgi:hypothetical protein